MLPPPPSILTLLFPLQTHSCRMLPPPPSILTLLCLLQTHSCRMLPPPSILTLLFPLQTHSCRMLPPPPVFSPCYASYKHTAVECCPVVKQISLPSDLHGHLLLSHVVLHLYLPLQLQQNMVSYLIKVNIIMYELINFIVMFSSFITERPSVQA